jgi:SAM-dependent methyltransferase
MDHVLEPVARYYAGKLRAHGTTARGVDWNSPDSQDQRFTELLRVVRGDRNASINDYGCGYGALAARLRRDGYRGSYCGYDVAPEMVHAATTLADVLDDCRFTSDGGELTAADYTVASGIFNVRLEASVDAWERHVRDTIDRMAALSLRGFAFNMLTSHADADRMRDDLYYADPAVWLTYCLRRFPRSVALLHDYQLYEFTMLVRTGQE